MRALVLTVGSRGDVQPFIALTTRLQAAGHDAVLAAPGLFGDLAAAHHVPFVPLDLDMNQVGAMVAGQHGLRHLVRFCQSMGRRAAGVLPGVMAAADRGADLVVHHPVLPIGQHLAELLGVPAVVAQPIPVLVPTGEFPSTAWPYRLPRILNRPSYRAVRHLTGVWCRKDIDRWRRDVLALPPRRGQHDPLRSSDGTPVTVLHGFSPHVLPRPADWPSTAHATGYWTLPAAPGWSPSRKLEEFLDYGDPVVYLGFGSMPSPDPERLAAAMVTAVRQAGARAVVASLSPELRRLLPASRFLVIRSVPHDWLFPRVQAIVHHGGSGTTAAAVLAGRPQVIWPFGGDQHFWSRRMATLGVAPPALPVRSLTAQTLTTALNHALGDRSLAVQAARLGARVRAEDGTGEAVSYLEKAAADTLDHPEAAKAIRSTISASSALLVPIVTRTNPSPGAPKLSPRFSATRPRSRKTSAGSGPSPSRVQSTQARKLASGGTYPASGSRSSSSLPNSART
jgi:sterol 3beta-glucosyltransferase